MRSFKPFKVSYKLAGLSTNPGIQGGVSNPLRLATNLWGSGGLIGIDPCFKPFKVSYKP